MSIYIFAPAKDIKVASPAHRSRGIVGHAIPMGSAPYYPLSLDPTPGLAEYNSNISMAIIQLSHNRAISIAENNVNVKLSTLTDFPLDYPPCAFTRTEEMGNVELDRFHARPIKYSTKNAYAFSSSVTPAQILTWYQEHRTTTNASLKPDAPYASINGIRAFQSARRIVNACAGIMTTSSEAAPRCEYKFVAKLGTTEKKVEEINDIEYLKALGYKTSNKRRKVTKKVDGKDVESVEETSTMLLAGLVGQLPIYAVPYGPVENIPSHDGLVFPFFTGMANSDPTVISRLFTRYFLRLFGQGPDALVLMSSFIDNISSAIDTRQGEVFTHMCLGMLWALDAGKQIFYLIFGKSYRGFVISGKNFQMLTHGSIINSVPEDEVKRLALSLSSHDIALSGLADILSEKAVGPNWPNKGEAPIVSFADFHSSCDVLYYVNQRIHALSEEERLQVMKLMDDIDFAGEDFTPFSVDELIKIIGIAALPNAKGHDDELSYRVNSKRFLGNGLVMSESRIMRLLSVFGSSFPTVYFPNYPKFFFAVDDASDAALKTVKEEVKEKKEVKIVERRALEKMYVRRVTFDESSSHWELVMTESHTCQPKKALTKKESLGHHTLAGEQMEGLWRALRKFRKVEEKVVVSVAIPAKEKKTAETADVIESSFFD